MLAYPSLHTEEKFTWKVISDMGGNGSCKTWEGHEWRS